VPYVAHVVRVLQDLTMIEAFTGTNCQLSLPDDGVAAALFVCMSNAVRQQVAVLLTAQASLTVTSSAQL
jgi:hypothetical protein